MIEFGRDAHQLFHTFRYVEEAGLNRDEVTQAILSQLQVRSDALSAGPYTGTLLVKGAHLEYRAYKFANGDIHVGRITVG